MIHYKGRNLIYAQTEQPIEQSRDVQMLLFGVISDEFGENQVNAHAFAAEMLFLHENGFNITVRINSEGGSVLHGFAILDAIRVTNSDTYAVGMAASMAGVILQFGKRRIMNDFASIMVHAPKGGDDQLLEIVSAQLKNILSARSKMTQDEIQKIFNDSEDIWFAVQGVPEERDAFAKGLVDEVVETAITSAKFARPDLESNYDGAKLYAIYNEILKEDHTKTQKETKMSNEYVAAKSKLNLGADATETEMINAITALETKANKKPESNTEEVDKLKNQVKQLTAEKVDNLIEQAKEAGYPENALDSLKTFATDNFDGAKQMVDAFKESLPEDGGEGGSQAQAGATPVSAQIPKKKPENNGGATKLKTYDEYMATTEGESEFYALNEEDQIKVLNQKKNPKPAEA